MTRFAKFAAIATLFTALAAPAALAQNVGTANVQKIFAELKETKDLEARLQAKGNDLKRASDAANAQVQSLQQQREMYKPGSPDYVRVNAQLEKTAITAQIELQVQQQQLIREQKTQTRQLFDKAVAAVASIAKEKQIAVVIAEVVPPQPSDDQLDRMTVEQLINLLRQQNLLYVSPGVDLTSEVIARMDAAYVAANPNAGAASPAPSPTAPATPN